MNARMAACAAQEPFPPLGARAKAPLAAGSTWVGGDGAVPRYFRRPRHKILQLCRQPRDVRRGRVLFERFLARERFDKGEVGRVVGVLQAARTSGSRARRARD